MDYQNNNPYSPSNADNWEVPRLRIVSAKDVEALDDAARGNMMYSGIPLATVNITERGMIFLNYRFSEGDGSTIAQQATIISASQTNEGIEYRTNLGTFRVPSYILAKVVDGPSPRQTVISWIQSKVPQWVKVLFLKREEK